MRREPIRRLGILASSASLLLACASSSPRHETTLPEAPTLSDARASVTARDEGPPPTDVDGYVARAIERSPAARAALAHWEAAHERVRASRRWPRPTLGYTALVRPVHTRAGPMRQKVSFAWPLPQFGALSAAENAAESRVVTASHGFAAVALTVRAQVAEAYWSLWGAKARAAVLELQAEQLLTVAEVLRARLATGATSLAAIQQLELRRARLGDALDSMRSHQAHHADHLAELVELEGMPELAETPPAIRWPAESAAALLESAAVRPKVSAELARAASFREEAAVHSARRRPQATFRLEWSEVGPAVMAGSPNDGDDALALGLTVALPFDVGTDRAAERAAEADARAAEASGEQVAREARLEVLAALAEVQNTARRAELHETTLEPQAIAAFESANARMATEGDVTLTLLALRELLEVRLGHVDALAQHAVAWAALERAVGRPVQSRGEGAAMEGSTDDR
ncbi:MAG: TolC family protein [Deltaproteobacteria bacterium]|nr:TolC family protein [Deltaproteobacteria bacterium]